jgi:hypothetical protein
MKVKLEPDWRALRPTKVLLTMNHLVRILEPWTAQLLEHNFSQEMPASATVLLISGCSQHLSNQDQPQPTHALSHWKRKAYAFSRGPRRNPSRQAVSGF